MPLVRTLTCRASSASCRAFTRRSSSQHSGARCWICREHSSQLSSHHTSRSDLLVKAGWATYGTLCSLLNPSVAASWPWEQQQSVSIQLPSSNFPFPLPFGIDYLLGHPFVTIGIATGLYVAIPRLWRLFVRFLLLPALAVAAVGFALQHPAATLSFGSTAFGFISTHPVIVSLAVIGFLAVTLSPYLLVIGFTAALFLGIPNLPGPIRPFVPQPLLQAESALTGVSQYLRGQAKLEAADVVNVSRKWPFGLLPAEPWVNEERS